MYIGSNVDGANYLWTKMDRTKTRWTNALYKLIHGPKSNGRKSFGRKSLGQNLHWTK